MVKDLLQCLAIGFLFFFLDPSGAIAQETLPASVLLAERLRLGEGFDPAVTFEAIVAADFGGDLLWVLDRHRVQSFDHEGSPRYGFGREGTGPGEFLVAGHFSVDSLIHVHDARLGRETIFRPDGTVVETISFSLEQLGGAGSVLPLSGGSQLLVSTPRFTAQEGGSDPFLHVILRLGGQRDTLASIRADGALWVRGRSYGGVEPGAGRGGAWAVSGDSLVFVVDGYGGMARWFCGPTFRICESESLGLQGRPFDRAALSAMLDPLEAATGRRPRESEIAHLPDSISIAADAVFSESGTEVWVQNDGSFVGGRLFTVLIGNGGVRRRIRFDAPVRIHAVSALGVLASQRGEFDEPILIWYQWVDGAF